MSLQLGKIENLPVLHMKKQFEPKCRKEYRGLKAILGT